MAGGVFLLAPALSPTVCDPSAARDRLLGAHEPLLRDVLAAADEVATSWSSPPRDRSAVVAPLRAALDDRDVPTRAAAALSDAAAAVGIRAGARPVPAPPYVVVTSRGLVMRLTDTDGERRLVATVGVFRVDRDGDPRYVRDATTPAEALSVAFR